MRCDECRALLQGLIDGDLDGRIRRELGRHLAGCAECAALIERERFWDEALLRHLDHELPPDLRDEILGDLADVSVRTPDTVPRLDRLDRRSQWRLVWWSLKRDFTEPAGLLLTVAVAAAVLVLALWWSDRNRAEPPFTQAGPIVRTVPTERQVESDTYEEPPTGSLTLSGRLI